MTTYCIFACGRMYTIQAAYFVASKMGVMFFNEDDDGIGLVPTCVLEMVKEMPAEKEAK